MSSFVTGLAIIFSFSFASANQCLNAVGKLEEDYPTQESKLADQNGFYNMAAATLTSDCKSHADDVYGESLVPSIIENAMKQCEESSNQMSMVYLANCYEKAAQLASALMPN